MIGLRKGLSGALVLLVWACGSTPAPRPTVTEFTAGDAAHFDAGVDFVANPEALEGRWAEQWNEELEGRVGRIDATALVHVLALRDDVDPTRRVTRRIVLTVDEVLFGPLEGSELTLIVGEDEPGFRTFSGNDERLLRQPFVVFIKWANGPDGALRPRFHLSPASDSVIDRVLGLLERRRGVERERPRTVVVDHRA